MDTNKDGKMDFEEFLIGVRGKPNAKRQAIIDKAFALFDKDGSGLIDPTDLAGVYCTKDHPKVRNGQLTEAQVFAAFLKNFGDVDNSKTITYQVKR